MGEELRCVKGCKKEGAYPDFSEKWGEWDNKKAAEKAAWVFYGGNSKGLY